MKPSENQAGVFANQALIIAAQKVSIRFDNFSGWLAAGLGAALAFLIANIDSMSSFIAPTSIKQAGICFLVSGALAVFAKLIAGFVAAGTAAGIEGAVLGKDMAKSGLEIDFDVFFAEMERALYWPGRVFARRAFAKLESGDFSGPGRMYVRLTQFHVVIVLIQALLSLAAALVVIFGLMV